MSDYICCEVGDLVIPRFGEYKGYICEVTNINGAYIYIHPVQMPNECVLEVYLCEIDLYEKYYEKRERKINKILK